VQVRVLASSMEYTDVVIRHHIYPQTMLRRPPFVLGYDVVGEIDQLGDGVSGFQVGDRVADMTVVGSNAAGDCETAALDQCETRSARAPA
jgi:NADPH:quinone reductase